MKRFALAIVCLAVACTRRDPPPPAGTTATASVDAGARGLHVDPRLLDEGRIKTAKVTSRPITGFMKLPANVIATAEGAAEAGPLLAGRVASFEAKEGDHVKRGQVLAWIDAPEAARAISDFVRARSRTETQARKVTRLEGLVANEAAAQAALDEARLELDLARADLAAARTVLGSLGLAEPPPTSGNGALPNVSARLAVKSPVDGVVVERGAPLGAHVTPDTHLFRIVSEGRVLVDARISDGVTVPAAGAVASILPRGADRCPAHVLATLPEVDPATRSRKVRITADAQCKGLVAGGQADVEIAIGGEGAQALAVPASALVELKTATAVFVALPARGSFEMRAVQPGARVAGDVVVAAGLHEGEDVVVEGAVLLKGELIRSELGGEE